MPLSAPYFPFHNKIAFRGEYEFVCVCMHVCVSEAKRGGRSVWGSFCVFWVEFVHDPACVHVRMCIPASFVCPTCHLWLLNKMWHNNWCFMSCKHGYGEYGLLWRGHWSFKMSLKNGMASAKPECVHVFALSFEVPQSPLLFVCLCALGLKLLECSAQGFDPIRAWQCCNSLYKSNNSLSLNCCLRV